MGHPLLWEISSFFLRFRPVMPPSSLPLLGPLAAQCATPRTPLAASIGWGVKVPVAVPRPMTLRNEEKEKWEAKQRKQEC